MAHYVAVLEAAINRLDEHTPPIREKIYQKARAALAAVLLLSALHPRQWWSGRSACSKKPLRRSKAYMPNKSRMMIHSRNSPTSLLRTFLMSSEGRSSAGRANA